MTPSIDKIINTAVLQASSRDLIAIKGLSDVKVEKVKFVLR